MIRNTLTKLTHVLAISFLLSLIFSLTVLAADDKSTVTARPSTSGKLHVDGTLIKDENDNTVVLHGVSTHGITWYPAFINKDLFESISTDWNCNIVRLAVYSDRYVNGEKKDSLDLVRKGIDAAKAADMYVIVDWHVLDEHDPNVYADEAAEFFETVCSEHPNDPGIIYEICNEPNGDTQWVDIRNYAQVMIPKIRAISPDSLILVGTPDYDRNLVSAVRYPLDFDNIMYTLHFYAATHKDDLRRELSAALDDDLPVFISECGISEASGDGTLDFESAASWFNLLRDHDMSYCVWSLSNKKESSALLKPAYDPKKELTGNDFSPAGTWVRDLLLGVDPSSIPVPEGNTSDSSPLSKITSRISDEELMPVSGWPRTATYLVIVLFLLQILVLIWGAISGKNHRTYDDICPQGFDIHVLIRRITLLLSTFFTSLYLIWRIVYSIPKGFGALPVIGNVMLLVVEILGFFESLILYANLMHLKDHPLPVIEDDEYPDVDIFIATYNEPCELLRKTINGCKHLDYPDKNKVHIWVCDDNRRSEMRALAEEMNVGYFDRPDNKGAKAGNLNHAMENTSSPYVVTLDADMIPMKGLLVNTIPYFVDAKKKNPDIKLGLLQTPQCFYQPDVFQHALYSETTAPNEQDFFYRTIEAAKTSTNSVVYGGSNTIIAREALDKVGGFYTETITEDFATGLLIESAGFVSLALSEPMASGMAPDNYKEHIQQRKRWGRGVIGTAKQLHLIRRRGLSMAQRLSYLSSVVYWFSPIKNLIYLISPLLYGVFAIPVFKCSWVDLLIYWFPMFIMQDICLRVFSKNAVSLKWSGIYETSVMPHLMIPIIRETFGITAAVFEVTDKTGKKGRSGADKRTIMPFIILIALSVFAIIRVCFVFSSTGALGIFILLFWLIRNLYFLIMSVFLVSGRTSDTENVKVIDAENISIKSQKDGSPLLYGVTTYLTEHNVKVFVDEKTDLCVGDRIDICIEKDDYKADMTGIITYIAMPRSANSCVYTIEITDMKDSRYEYLQILYDRIPTLPQSLRRDIGIVYHLLVNIAHRILE